MIVRRSPMPRGIVPPVRFSAQRFASPLVFVYMFYLHVLPLPPKAVMMPTYQYDSLIPYAALSAFCFDDFLRAVVDNSNQQGIFSLCLAQTLKHDHTDTHRLGWG